jgi:hypothetical protein
MGRRAAIGSTLVFVVLPLVAVVSARAADDSGIVNAAADGFHALRRIEHAGVPLVPLTDDELAADPRTGRNVPPRSSVLGPQFPEASELSRSVEDPSPQGSGARENSGVLVPSTSPAPRPEFPDTRGASRSIDDPSALERGADESSSVKMERGSEAPAPSAKVRPVEEEPDPRAVIDWLLKDYRQRLR